MRIFIIPILGMAMLVSGCNSTHKDSLIIQNSHVNKSTLPLSIHQKIEKYSKKHNVPYKFASAVIYVESKYNPRAYGKKTYGLGQIKCNTAKGLGFQGICKDLFDIDINLEYTMRYLKKALDISKGNECHAATLYNRGIGNRPKNSSYCKKVLAKYHAIK